MTEYIISLTTMPCRFKNIHLTIDSILNQTILPTKIIIHIPRKYNFRVHTEISKDKIDSFINKYSDTNIVVNIIENDYGPGTKLLGLLSSDTITDIKPDTYIILIDDDNIYKPYMIEYFDNYMKINNCVCASYYVYNNKINIGQGTDGFFIKFDYLKNFLQYYNVIRNYDYLNYIFVIVLLSNY
jgi:hypothetical protein